MPLLFCLGQHPVDRSQSRAGRRRKTLSRTWTICTLYVPREGSGRCTISSRGICGAIQRHPSTLAKRKCGTGVGPSLQLALGCSAPPDWHVPALSFGEETPDYPRTNRGSRWLVCPISWRNFWRKIAEHRVLLGRILEVPDTSWHDCSCPVVQPLVRISTSGRSVPNMQNNSQPPMMKACGSVCAEF